MDIQMNRNDSFYDVVGSEHKPVTIFVLYRSIATALNLIPSNNNMMVRIIKKSELPRDAVRIGPSSLKGIESEWASPEYLRASRYGNKIKKTTE